MLKRNSIRVSVFLLVIAATGCAASRPIAIDGRILSINDLAARMNYEYHGGVSKVANSRPKVNQGNRLGSFVMTLFNIRATANDLPDMIGSFRNYCQYRGGVQKVLGGRQENSTSFSIACEPKQPSYDKDPAYFLFFVNVLLSPKVLSNTDTYGSNLEARQSNTDSYRPKTNARRSNAGTYRSYSDASRTNSNRSVSNTEAYRSKNDYRSNSDGYWSITESYWSYTDGYRPETDGPRSNVRAARSKAGAAKSKAGAAGSNAVVYCVNFLASENRTKRTAFSNMQNYTDYRKSFEAVLNETKSNC